MNSQALLRESYIAENFDFKEAKNRLENILLDTKLIYSEIFTREFGNEVYIKPENIQRTGSFKIRGAYNKISKLSDEDKQKGLIASSAGNHAQGVAYSAQKLGVKATIVMPRTTPLIKVEATRAYGVDVVLHGDCYDEAYKEARRLEKENGYHFIHPFDDMDVIEGQGTIGLEIMHELYDVDYILVPIGGGGLVSGVAMAAKSVNPNVKIIGIEPEGAQSMKRSLENRSIISLDKVNTIADGVAVKTPGTLTYSIVRDYVDQIITVSDFEIMDSFLMLLQSHKLIGENAGLLSIAALKKLNAFNKKVVCLVSGGNIDVLTISSLINQGLVSRGRIFCFTVNLPDKPGELLRISEIIARLSGNVIKLDHNQFKGNNRFMEVQLEVTVETYGHEHVKDITNELKLAGYDIVKQY